MSFQQLLSVLKARKLVAICIFAFTVVVTVAISIALPKQYTAEATVVVDVKSPDPIAGMVLPGMMSPSYMGTQIEVIQSERVARRVIAALRLTEINSIRDQWQQETDGEGSYESWLTDVLERRLTVKPGRDSNVISISYTAPDPRFASAFYDRGLARYSKGDLAGAIADGLGDLLGAVRDFRNENHVGSAGNARAEGKPAGAMAHHFDDDDAVVARGG